MATPPQVPVGVALGFGVVPQKGEHVGHRVTYNWTLDQTDDAITGAEGYYHTLREVLRGSDGPDCEAVQRADVRLSTDMFGETATVSYTDPDTGARVTAHFEAALISAQTWDLLDLHWRMLTVPEIRRGMGFREDFIVWGTSRQRVAGFGNAVVPAQGQWVVEQLTPCIQGAVA